MSMIVYLLLFLSSGVLASLGGHFRRSDEGRFLSLVFLALAVLLPSIVAGCRDYTIGTDTNGYVRFLFAAALNSQDVGQYFVEQIDLYEPGYLLLTFLSTHIVPDMHFLLFLAEAITLSTMMLSIIKTSRGYGFGAAYSAYLILHYNESLNLVRQSLAIAFVMLAIAYLLKSQYLKYCIAILVAISFHTSGVIGFAFLVIKLFIGRTNSLKGRKDPLNMKVSSILISFTLIVAPIVFAIAFRPIMSCLIGLGIVSDKYDIYLSDYSTGIAPLLLGVYLTTFFILYLARAEFKDSRFFVISYAYGVILFLLTGISQHLWRLGTYFNTTVSLSLSQLHSRTREETYRIWAAKIVILCLSILLWYMQIIVWGNHDTFPYTSVLLGI